MSTASIRRPQQHRLRLGRRLLASAPQSMGTEANTEINVVTTSAHTRHTHVETEKRRRTQEPLEMEQQVLARLGELQIRPATVESQLVTAVPAERVNPFLPVATVSLTTSSIYRAPQQPQLLDTNTIKPDLVETLSGPAHKTQTMGHAPKRHLHYDDSGYILDSTLTTASDDDSLGNDIAADDLAMMLEDVHVSEQYPNRHDFMPYIL